LNKTRLQKKINFCIYAIRKKGKSPKDAISTTKNQQRTFEFEFEFENLKKKRLQNPQVLQPPF
jgi:hypothetical protein